MRAKAIAALHHPGICAIYDVGTTPIPFLVMELLEGETLHQRLLRGPLEVPALTDTGLALADALSAAHAHGVIHRDLKPANIFLTAHGPKILDFGLARVGTASLRESGGTAVPTQAPLTDVGVAVGTAAYMSPEQLRGDALDERSDLFSLGLVLYEMATGRRTFAGTTAAATSAAILHAQPIMPRQLRPDLPLRLEETILALLEKDCDVRMQTASELRAVLMRLKRELTGTRPLETSAPRPDSSDAQLMVAAVRRHRGALAIAGAVLLVAVLGVAYFVKSRTSAATVTANGSSLSNADLEVEQLTTSGTADAPAVSPDGNWVVYVERGLGRDSLRLRQVATGSNVELVPPETGTALQGATITPDGVFVNYVKQAGSEDLELWQVPLLGGSARRLLQAGRVGFSPHGDQMAYVRTGDAGETELMVASSDGSGERALASRQQPEPFWPGSLRSSLAPAWSPDGATIAVLGGRDGESATGQVVFVDVTSGKERTADAGSTRMGAGVAWLTDDTLLASMLDRPSAPLQLWLVSRAELTFRRLSNDISQYAGVSVTADGNAVVTARLESSFSIWTSDATATKPWSVAVPTRRSKGPVGNSVRWVGDDLVYVSSSSRGFALSRWRGSTQSEEMLAQGGGNPSVTRDGSTIFFLDYDSRQLWKMDSTSRTQVPLGRAVLFPEAAHVTPDGRHYVTMDIGASGAPGILLNALNGTNTSREITADPIRITAGVLDGGRVEVSPDRRWIAYPSVGEGNQPVIAVCDVASCSSKRLLSARPDGAGCRTARRSRMWIRRLCLTCGSSQLTAACLAS